MAENYAIRNIDLAGADAGKPMDEAALLTAIQGKNVLLLIHGYRNPQENVRAAYRDIEQRMAAGGLLGAGKAYDIIIGYTWPGGILHVSYPLSRKWAEKSGTKHVRPLLTKLIGAAGTRGSVDVNTHSLGARVALYALIQGNIKLRNLWMLAPAVDDDSIEHGEKFDTSAQSAKRTYLLHSRQDGVLKFTFPLCEFDKALGYEGPEHPALIKDFSRQVRVVDCTRIVDNHSGYRMSAPVYQYMLDEYTNPNPQQFVTL